MENCKLNVINKTHIKIILCFEYLSNMQPNNVDSVQNKELLWTTLQESGAFTGLSREQFEPVKLAFDRAVQQASRTAYGSLNDANKQIIRQFVQTELPAIRSVNSVTAPKKKKIEVVYRAEDIQNERANEFERQLREKQAEMDSFLTLKKPTDVSFTDAVAVEDKPIGDEMSRLIANELAARERELVQLKPEDIKKAQQWIGTNANNVATAPAAKKTVSFSNATTTNIVEEHEVEQFEPESNNHQVEDTVNEELGSIFSKFKRISEPQASESVSITTQQLYNKILELEKTINANHAEIISYLKKTSQVQ
jgi:hypothetical protein